MEIKIPVPFGHISGKTYGSEDLDPVLCLHGWSYNAGSFEPLINYLPKKYFYVLIDFPGHGLSSHLPAGISYEYTEYVLSIRRIIKHFKWRTVSLMGHSLGAGLAVFYAALYPTEIKRCIMIDLCMPMSPIPSLEDHENISNYAEKMSSCIDRFLIVDEKSRNHPPLYSYEEAIKKIKDAAQIDQKLADAFMVRGAKKIEEDKWVFTKDLRIGSTIINRFSPEVMFNILQNIICPILIIKAKDSSFYDPKENCDRAIETYKERAKHFEYHLVEGNHFLHMNNPETIFQIIVEFLNISV